jgi:hypothetical protein
LRGGRITITAALVDLNAFEAIALERAAVAGDFPANLKPGYPKSDILWNYRKICPHCQ